ncbi:MAG: F0F1 ATP synthase subunit B [Pseudomonadota bacterium]|nr:F0F1 ATP synthase subunit B [Pseudomonadota bacterium]
MDHVLENPETWVLVAFIVFVALVAKKAWGFITANLDERGERISAELEEAAKLREDAQSLLSEYQRDHRGLQQEINRMLERAREERDALISSAEEKVANQLAQKEAQAEQNLRHAEAKVIEEIRLRASEYTIRAARELIGRKTDAEKASALIDDSINEVGAKLSSRGH